MLKHFHLSEHLSNLSVFQALTEYKAELRNDPIINIHLAKLYDSLLEQNLIRVIEPFSRVQVRPPGVFIQQTALCRCWFYTFMHNLQFKKKKKGL